jgi:DNA-binding MarR family transcriptional regulator
MSSEEIVLPALLRAARSAYGQSVRSSLAKAGFDDLPPNGAFVLGGIVNHAGAPSDLIRQLRVSKQAASQLIDTLVLRGYLERHPDADDRRRMTIGVTDRGKAAAAAVRAGVVAVDDELATILSPDELLGLRAGLVALIQIAERAEKG